jgi:hypothetical protein
MIHPASGLLALLGTLCNKFQKCETITVRVMRPCVASSCLSLDLEWGIYSALALVIYLFEIIFKFLYRARFLLSESLI